MLKNYLITYLTSCENLKLIKVGVLNPDLAMLFIPLCGPEQAKHPAGLFLVTQPGTCEISPMWIGLPEGVTEPRAQTLLKSPWSLHSVRELKTALSV